MSEALQDLLRSRGLRSTRQRVGVLEILSRTNQLLSAEDLYVRLTKDKDHLHLCTVYRVLDQFVTEGLAVKTMLGPAEKALYRIAGDHHEHWFVCRKCHCTLPIPLCPLKHLEKSLPAQMGVLIEGHRLELFGLCGKCA